MLKNPSLQIFPHTNAELNCQFMKKQACSSWLDQCGTPFWETEHSSPSKSDLKMASHSLL